MCYVSTILYLDGFISFHFDCILQYSRLTCSSISLIRRFFPHASSVWSDNLFLLLVSPWLRGDTLPPFPFPAMLPFRCTPLETCKNYFVVMQLDTLNCDYSKSHISDMFRMGLWGGGGRKCVYVKMGDVFGWVRVC